MHTGLKSLAEVLARHGWKRFVKRHSGYIWTVVWYDEILTAPVWCKVTDWFLWSYNLHYNCLEMPLAETNWWWLVFSLGTIHSDWLFFFLYAGEWAVHARFQNMIRLPASSVIWVPAIPRLWYSNLSAPRLFGVIMFQHGFLVLQFLFVNKCVALTLSWNCIRMGWILRVTTSP